MRKLNKVLLIAAILIGILVVYSPLALADTRSQIDGEFEGFEYGNVYVLMNGEIWQQVDSTYRYHYAYCPAVIIFNSGGMYMAVQGVDVAVAVQQLR